MKKLLYSILFAVTTSIIVSSCTEQNIKPRDAGGAGDQCQFGGPGCPARN